MSQDEIIKKQVSGSKGLMERAISYIPLYGGYRKRNIRRDVDREVRMFVVRTLKGVKIDLGNIHRDVVDSGDMNLARDVERLRTKVDTHATRIEKAVNGYSGVWANVKKKDEELDAVIEWDVKLLEGADDLRKLSEKIRTDADDGNVTKDSIRGMENNVDDLLENFMQRDAVLKGFTEDNEEDE